MAATHDPVPPDLAGLPDLPLVDLLERAVAGTGQLVATLRGEPWQLPTPCPGLDVAALGRQPGPAPSPVT